LESSNRRWQNHLKSKGVIPFFLDRLQSHALSSAWQYGKGVFDFPVNVREEDDELSRAFFEMTDKFPYEIYLETTNYCNLNCKMCARQNMARENGSMAMPLFKRIIDEIAEESPYSYIHFYGIGEPLMDPDIFARLAYAHGKGLKNTILFSNGQLLLDNDNCKRLCESGLASIGVDVDGVSEGTYGEIRVGGNLNRVREGIEKLYSCVRESNTCIRVELAFHVYCGVNDSEIDSFRMWCDDKGYEYKLVTMHSWAGLCDEVPQTSVDGLMDIHHSRRITPCSALWNGFVIGWDGRVATCFQDTRWSKNRAI